MVSRAITLRFDELTLDLENELDKLDDQLLQQQIKLGERLREKYSNKDAIKEWWTTLPQKEKNRLEEDAAVANNAMLVQINKRRVEQFGIFDQIARVLKDSCSQIKAMSFIDLINYKYEINTKNDVLLKVLAKLRARMHSIKDISWLLPNAKEEWDYVEAC